MLPASAIRWWFALALTLLSAVPAWATFTDIGAGITGVNAPAVAWGDYDSDGDLDFVMIGTTVAGDIARIYRNTGGAFADAVALPADAVAHNGAVAWGDYDRDGDLDLALAGLHAGVPVTRIYRNDLGAFTDIAAGLPGVSACAISWVDFDNDGDLDLAFGGDSGAGGIARIYRNTAGVFVDAAVSITGLTLCAMAWGDYDNDGDSDLAISGMSGTTPVTNLYRNSGGAFTLMTWPVTGVSRGSLNFGDFDNDGDLDLTLSGNVASSPITRIYRNSVGFFANANAVIQGVNSGGSIWGDADNDGDLDIALAGNTASTGFAAVYLNTGIGMSDMNAGLTGVAVGSLAWGDYDNDADLDLLLVGNRFLAGPQSAAIYRNSGVPANTPPTAPLALFATSDSANVTFHWSMANDAQNGRLGLSYNLWAGTAPGLADVLSPMANVATGFRLVPQRGNADENLQWTLPRAAFSGNHVYWGVQAIDQAFAGSPFATADPHTLAVDDVLAPGPALRLLGPNPTRSEAHFVYSLPRATRVSLNVFDIAGRPIATLANGDRAAGEHTVRWNAAHAAPGLYLVRLNAGALTTALRVVRIQ